MEFFDKLGKKASEAYKVTADKTGKIAKEAKLKMKMADLKSQANDIYEEIGKKVYEKHVREENISIKEELQEECEKIDNLSKEIEEARREILKLNNKRQCPECYAEIEKDAAFCSKCGHKLEAIEVVKPEQVPEEKVEDVVEEKTEASEDVNE